MATKKKSERIKLTERADKEMSRYIRLFHADKYGYCTCVTCGVRAYWKGEGMQMGHFVNKGRGASGVRYLHHNAFPQCSICNCTGGHVRQSHNEQIAQIRYTKFMQEEYGQGVIDDLLQRKFQPMRYTDEDLREIAASYKESADELERRL